MNTVVRCRRTLHQVEFKVPDMTETVCELSSGIQPLKRVHPPQSGHDIFPPGVQLPSANVTRGRGRGRTASSTDSPGGVDAPGPAAAAWCTSTTVPAVPETAGREQWMHDRTIRQLATRYWMANSKNTSNPHTDPTSIRWSSRSSLKLGRAIGIKFDMPRMGPAFPKLIPHLPPSGQMLVVSCAATSLCTLPKCSKLLYLTISASEYNKDWPLSTCFNNGPPFNWSMAVIVTFSTATCG